MSRRILCLGLVIGVTVAVSLAQSSDPELDEGVRLVRQGEYGQAIILLERVARRLAQKPALKKEAAQAYLQLGIAYVGQDQETLAKASFREAVAKDDSMELNAFDESPKVRELFQKAKDELAQQKKRGRRTLPILLGIGAAGGIGAAVAIGGKNSAPSMPAVSGTGDIVLLGIDPPSGSTISLGTRGVKVTVSLTVVLPASDTYVLGSQIAKGDVFLGRSGNCLEGLTGGMSFIANRVYNITIQLLYPAVNGTLEDCLPRPLATSQIRTYAIRPADPQPRTDVLRRQFNVSYRFVD